MDWGHWTGWDASDGTILNVLSLKSTEVCGNMQQDGHFCCKIVLIICSIDCIHFAHHHFLINPIVKHWGASPFSSHLKEWVTRALCKISKDCHHFEKPCGSSAFLAFIMRTGANAETLPLYVQLFRPLKKTELFFRLCFLKMPFCIVCQF